MAQYHREQIIQANGIEICADSFGETDAPPILLIMGASASMILWEDAFCHRLAEGGRFVIRFDNRDVGRTTVCPPGQPNYSMQDMADDAVSVLDFYGVEQAHIVGASMGGMIAQIVGIRHPQRVLTLVPIMSSPDPGAVTDAMEGKPTRYQLSPPADRILEMASSTHDVDWSNHSELLESRVRNFGLSVGSAHPYDESSRRDLFRREIERATNYQSSQNHQLVVGLTDRWYEHLETIQAPTLVIHGTEDPILPFDHGQALADSIPDAQLMVLDGVGHELPEPEYDRVIAAILKITHQ